jgi:hypothetical protein
VPRRCLTRPTTTSPIRASVTAASTATGRTPLARPTARISGTRSRATSGCCVANQRFRPGSPLGRAGTAPHHRTEPSGSPTRESAGRLPGWRLRYRPLLRLAQLYASPALISFRSVVPSNFNRGGQRVVCTAGRRAGGLGSGHSQPVPCQPAGHDAGRRQSRHTTVRSSARSPARWAITSRTTSRATS